MARKPKFIQSKNLVKVSGRDTFQTPNYATKLLLPFIPKYIENILEPACGYGKISNVLKEFGYTVYESDLQLFDGKVQKNFITETIDIYHEGIDCIITNPPFSLKKEFYHKCLSYNIPFALLIPADYCGWICEAIDKDNVEKIIPNRRINYITPNYREGTTFYFHSLWLTWGFNIGKQETIVNLTKEMQKDI